MRMSVCVCTYTTTRAHTHSHTSWCVYTSQRLACIFPAGAALSILLLLLRIAATECAPLSYIIGPVSTISYGSVTWPPLGTLHNNITTYVCIHVLYIIRMSIHMHIILQYVIGTVRGAQGCRNIPIFSRPYSLSEHSTVHYNNTQM